MHEQAEPVGLFDDGLPVETRFDFIRQLAAEEFRNVTARERCGDFQKLGELHAAENFRVRKKIGGIEFVADDVLQRGLDIGSHFCGDRPHDSR